MLTFSLCASGRLDEYVLKIDSVADDGTLLGEHAALGDKQSVVGTAVVQPTSGKSFRSVVHHSSQRSHVWDFPSLLGSPIGVSLGLWKVSYRDRETEVVGHSKSHRELRNERVLRCRRRPPTEKSYNCP